MVPSDFTSPTASTSQLENGIQSMSLSRESSLTLNGSQNFGVPNNANNVMWNVNDMVPTGSLPTALDTFSNHNNSNNSLNNNNNSNNNSKSNNNGINISNNKESGTLPKISEHGYPAGLDGFHSSFIDNQQQHSNKMAWSRRPQITGSVPEVMITPLHPLLFKIIFFLNTLHPNTNNTPWDMNSSISGYPSSNGVFDPRRLKGGNGLLQTRDDIGIGTLHHHHHHHQPSFSAATNTNSSSINTNRLSTMSDSSVWNNSSSSPLAFQQQQQQQQQQQVPRRQSTSLTSSPTLWATTGSVSAPSTAAGNGGMPSLDETSNSNPMSMATTPVHNRMSRFFPSPITTTDLQLPQLTSQQLQAQSQSQSQSQQQLKPQQQNPNHHHSFDFNGLQQQCQHQPQELSSGTRSFSGGYPTSPLNFGLFGMGGGAAASATASANSNNVNGRPVSALGLNTSFQDMGQSQAQTQQFGSKRNSGIHSGPPSANCIPNELNVNRFSSSTPIQGPVSAGGLMTPMSLSSKRLSNGVDPLFDDFNLSDTGNPAMLGIGPGSGPGSINGNGLALGPMGAFNGVDSAPTVNGNGIPHSFHQRDLSDLLELEHELENDVYQKLNVEKRKRVSTTCIPKRKWMSGRS
ncbi:unnamed protein product [Ambrosiozyma monospora]|uniref:Unnamed protein product n=1 Tax=Ambrosiozyma monospora TaxID=43982 RepID=A0A9W6YU96_AMBMO|nr:unnamed protein product [Ambrosiozyma monospora]